MFRTAFSLFSGVAVNHLTAKVINKSVVASFTRSINPVPSVNFSSLTQKNINIKNAVLPSIGLMKNDFLQPKLQSQEQIRTVIKFSWKKGTRKSVKAVPARFYRLNCGNWIRTIAGRFKKSWKKSAKRRCKHMQHVFCNATQSRMLDKMVAYYWRRPKYYIKNPYEPYEWRENYRFTRTKPWRPEGVDYE